VEDTVTPPREHVAQQAPRADHDLSRFPRRTLKEGAAWFRQHAAGVGPWWFSSNGAGRFDLPAPRGTCCLASSAHAAVEERVGPDLAAHGLVPSSLLEGRLVSGLKLPHPVVAANVDSAAASRHGITRELAVMVPYEIPQRWAAALAAAGFDGIVAGLRFTPGTPVGLALFGKAGERTSWARDAQPRFAAAVAPQMGLRVVEPPRADELTVVTPSD